MKKKYLVILLAIALVVGTFGSAFANSKWDSLFSSTYPSSSTLSSFGCQTCHVPAGPPSRNPYGAAFASAGHNLQAIESADSDGDGSSNIAEITAGTNPGDATSKPAPAACTDYTYSTWSVCGANGQQTRTVTGNTPAGCTGTPSTAAVLTQACTPPVTTCTSFTYNSWGACQANNTQSRTVATSSPAGCTGGTPALTQSCVYTPPVTTCTSFTYNEWGACQADSTQSRTVATSSPSGCTGGSPALTQSCTYVPPVNACTSFTYSAWTDCQSNNTQTQTVVSSLPAGCTGGSPLLTQICVYVPPVTPPPAGTMPVPTSQESFVYDAVDQPVVSTDPAAAKPIGFGPLATGGGTADLTVKVGPFEKPVNVSLFAYSPSVDYEELYFMNSDRELGKLSDAVDNAESLSSSTYLRENRNVPLSTKFRRISFWKKNVTDVNEHIYQGPVTPGYYTFVLVVKSVDNDDEYYSWATHILVPKISEKDKHKD